MTSPASAPATRVIVLVWDGMRPDQIDPKTTPNLYRLVQEGTQYAHASAVFPSVTRSNGASLSTGAQPGEHGITGNTMPVAALDGKPINIGNREQLERLRAGREGRVLLRQTLAEHAVMHGRRTVVMGTCSTGQATLLDPERVAATIHHQFSWPETLDAEVQERVGPPPSKGSPPNNTLNNWLIDALIDYVLPVQQPELVMAWLCEPDGSQHAYGVGSPEAVAAIRANDDCLGRLLQAIDTDAVPTALIVVSDHGHSSMGRIVDVPLHISRPSLQCALADGTLVYTDMPDQFTILDTPGAAEIDAELRSWLAEADWIDTIAVWPGRETSDLPTAVPIDALWGGTTPSDAETAASYTLTHLWGPESNHHGIPGFAGAAPEPGEPESVSWHGSLSPFDMNITLVLSGAGVRNMPKPITGPAGIIDVAPTVSALLGLPPMPQASGRVLHEALGSTSPLGQTPRVHTFDGPAGGPITVHRLGRHHYIAPTRKEATP